MGTTIHYRGTLRRPDAVEPLQDRVFDLALQLGGKARYWHSRGDGPRPRTVRGVILHLAPGCDTVSLLFSEEGHLVPLFAIEEAEKGPFDERPFVFAKTQSAPLEAHVALVALLKALRASDIPDLEVRDDAGYFESGDLRELTKRSTTRESFESLTARLQAVERLVAATMRRAPEHPPATLEPHEEETEAHWDALYAESQRKVERLQERIARDGPGALRRALEELDLDEDPDELEDDDDDGEEVSDVARAMIEQALDGEGPETDETGLPGPGNPYRKRLEAIFHGLRELPGAADEAARDVLMDGICDAMGGVVQATGLPGDPADGLAIVQLKRALRGLAFAQGALHAAVADPAARDRLWKEIDEIAEGLTEWLGELRKRLGAGGST